MKVLLVLVQKLERLVQRDGDSALYTGNGAHVLDELRVGSMITIKVQNPLVDLSFVIDDLAKEGRNVIPRGANAYLVSLFNPDTQFIQDGKAYSCYALQFYHICSAV